MKQGKQFEIWPYAIIAVFIVFGSGVIYALIQASNHNSPLVTEDYYNEELAFQKQIDKKNITAKLGKEVKVTLNRNEHNLLLHFPLDTFPTTQTSGNITLYRASDDKLDQVFELNTNAEGEQLLNLKDLIPGYWKVLIDWKEGGVAFYQEEEIII